MGTCGRGWPAAPLLVHAPAKAAWKVSAYITGQLSGSAVAVTTSLNLSTWSRDLECHPNREVANYIEQGISKGFRIGFEYLHGDCQAATTPLRSGGEQPKVIADYIRKELQEGRITEITNPAEMEGLQVSLFGVKEVE